MEILKKVTELKAELDAMRPLDADRKAAIMQKLRLDWNFHSNHLEGNSLNYGETRALILFGITAAGKPLKDHFEMTGHDEAIKWVEDVVKEKRPLTENFIRELHKLILKEPYESPTVTPEGVPAKRIIKIGEYKSTPNHVKTPTGEIFRFATPEETPAKMHDLIEWYREKEKDKETHPLLLAAEFHYKFIRIHPFDDGNGRTARILMNFILMKHGYPPVIVRTEEKEDKYFPALRQADAGSITPFIEYLGNNLAHSLDLMIRGAKGENIDEADDVDKEIALIEQKLQSVGSHIEKALSKNTALEVFETSIHPLIVKFYEENEKIKLKYKSIKLFMYYGKKRRTDLSVKYNDIERLKELFTQFSINADFCELILRFDFKDFTQPGMEVFDYQSELIINFHKDSYIITSNNKKKSISKHYHEKLNKDEIQELVRIETKAHTDFIYKQIELAQKGPN